MNGERGLKEPLGDGWSGEAETVDAEPKVATYSMNPGVARSERPQSVQDANGLLASARRSFTEANLDEAVRCAEDFLDLAVWEHDPAALASMASAIPLLDTIFSARLGPRSGLVRLGAPTDAVKKLLSLPALELLSRITKPMTIHDVISTCGAPEQDCVRLLAGLLRRKVLVSWQDHGRSSRWFAPKRS